MDYGWWHDSGQRQMTDGGCGAKAQHRWAHGWRGRSPQGSLEAPAGDAGAMSMNLGATAAVATHHSAPDGEPGDHSVPHLPPHLPGRTCLSLSFSDASPPHLGGGR